MRRSKGLVPANDSAKPVAVDLVQIPAIDAHDDGPHDDATVEHLFRRLESEQIAIEGVDLSEQSAAPRLDLMRPAMLSLRRTNVSADVNRLSRELAEVWHLRRNTPSR